MRRTIQFSLSALLAFALLAVSAPHHALAQRRGGGGGGERSGGERGGGHSFARGGGHGFSRPRVFLPSGFGGYGDMPYDSGSDYSYEPQPAVFIQPPPPAYVPPAPRVFNSPGHAVITEYKWPNGGLVSAPAPESEPQTFSIVLKDGSTLSAQMVFASDDGLHYVDSDENHLRVSMSQVDRAATLKLNRARNLNLYLPAAQ
jgi:hypothetical protein